MVTIKDIARQLGISPSTVARALADHPHTSAATKARVRSTAEALGYVAHSAARIMRGRPSALIGLLIPDVQNDFYATVAKALAESCNEAGYQLVLALTEDDPIIELKHVRQLVGARAAGVIIVPSRSPQRETMAMLRRLPVVQLIRQYAALRADWFGIDDERAMLEATRHLVELGHRRIAYIGGHEGLSSGRARLGGFRRGLAEAGLDADAAAVATGPPRVAFARAALARIIDDGAPGAPGAIIAGGVRLTVGILEELHGRGLVMPRDLSFVGFGDPPWFQWCRPALTTIGLPVRDLTFAAGAHLLHRIRDAGAPDFAPQRTPYRSVQTPFLIVRDSTAPPAGRQTSSHTGNQGGSSSGSQ
jgi:LacI family transcriptional regulator, repressor for deo operon, udp, cdd, tsx, nupC, and nupG